MNTDRSLHQYLRFLFVGLILYTTVDTFEYTLIVGTACLLYAMVALRLCRWYEGV
jgi:hypothetical protein